MFRSFFASRKYRHKAWGIGLLLVVFLGVNLYINFQLSYFAQDLGDFWKKGPLTHAALGELVALGIWLRCRYMLTDPMDEFCGRHFGLFWRQAVSEELVQRWIPCRELVRGHNASQLIQQAVYDCTRFFEDVGFQVLRSGVLLFFYLPQLWAVSPLLKIRSPWDFDIPGILAIVLMVCAVIGGAISLWIGYPLIAMGKRNQDTESHLRTQCERVENQRSGEVSPAVFDPFFKVVYASYARMWRRGIPFKAWNSFYWHAMLLLPIYVVGGWYVDGIVRFGVMMRIFFLFNEASVNFSTITNNWGRILDFLATYRRLKAFSEALVVAEQSQKEQEEKVSQNVVVLDRRRNADK